MEDPLSGPATYDEFLFGAVTARRWFPGGVMSESAAFRRWISGHTNTSWGRATQRRDCGARWITGQRGLVVFSGEALRGRLRHRGVTWLFDHSGLCLSDDPGGCEIPGDVTHGPHHVEDGVDAGDQCDGREGQARLGDGH